jgi:hypothetical protein
MKAQEGTFLFNTNPFVKIACRRGYQDNYFMKTGNYRMEQSETSLANGYGYGFCDEIYCYHIVNRSWNVDASFVKSRTDQNIL